ncbi:hypothetical protein LGV61_04255 [Desulfurispirillum indicum]|uniref:hypothetical protein n=1 Tax=Desulfurispirillum indicum TaxID=936456 RepID=UPI001CFA7F32|nr:hypothetical protein [Desulfurispirillum indicum]UCZ57497.1 hypothetical protein LGV61_04255 [Desulfurispirillum indicum]
MAGVSVKMEVDSIDLAEIQQNIIVNGYGYRQPAKNLARIFEALDAPAPVGSLATWVLNNYPENAITHVAKILAEKPAKLILGAYKRLSRPPGR